MLAVLHAPQIQTALQDIFAIKTPAVVNYHLQTNALQALQNSKSAATAEQSQESAKAMECGALTEHATIRANAHQEQPHRRDALMVAIKFVVKAVSMAHASVRVSVIQGNNRHYLAAFAVIKQEHVRAMECGVLTKPARIQGSAHQEPPQQRVALVGDLRDVWLLVNTVDALMKEFVIQELLNQNHAEINAE
jgi:hypothetical protein